MYFLVGGMKLVNTLSSLLRPSPPSLYSRLNIASIRMLSASALENKEPPPAKRRRLDPAMSLQTPTPTPIPTISLTPEEETVRKLLVDVAAEIDSTSRRDDKESLTLRFTGGWVRDKLLGEQCHDIDVGINKMTGFDFATRLGKFLAERQVDYNIPTRSIHKIESNPEKSKHLETATTKILGLDIDFVNLRSETYSEDSRIPQMVCMMSSHPASRYG